MTVPEAWRKRRLRVPDTMPRSRPNCRLKDLPDIALPASRLVKSAGAIDAATLRMALRRTFEFRATHTLPDDVPQPPTNWQTPYAVIAQSDELIWPTIDELHRAVRAFLGPVLGKDESDDAWSPADWRWARGV